MKQCVKCGVEKPEETFELYKKGKYRRTECRDCRNAEQQAWRAQRKLKPPKPKIDEKWCIQCQEIKPLSDFSPSSPGYFHGRCKACEVAVHRQKRREQYQNDPTMRFYRPFMNDAGVMVKRCTRCYTEKPLSDFSISRSIRQSKCKECCKALKKADYDAHPEKYREAVLRSARKHPDRVRARRQRWYANNKEQRARYSRSHVAANRERYLNYYRIRHIRDYEQEKAYRVAHRYELSEVQARRRARVQNAPIVEKIDRNALIERDKWTCYLCGVICTPKNVTLDHVVPLYRGGSHTADNLRVACLSCNCSKGGKLLGEFLK